VISGYYDYREESPLWMRAEYLYSCLGDRSLPALVTTSPNGTLRAEAGVLGEPDTALLAGGSSELSTPGVRGFFGIRLGHWFDHLGHSELETSLMWLGEDTGSTHGPSTGDPILARPFFDTSSGNQNSSLVAFPGVVDGSVSTEVSSEIHSLGVLVRRNLSCSQHWRIDGVAGYRYFKLREKLAVEENLTVAPVDAANLPTFIGRSEYLSTRNYFHGGEVDPGKRRNRRTLAASQHRRVHGY
jgi:hypothetical protein